MRHRRPSTRSALPVCLTLLLLPLFAGAPVAQATSDATDDDVIRTLVEYVLSHQADDGSFRGGPLDTGDFHTPGAIEALSAAGLDPREVRVAPGKPSAADWLRDHRVLYNPLYPTDWEKQILGIAAAYGNPNDFGGFDYVAELRGHFKNGQMGSSGHLNDDMFGLLAMRAAGVPPSDSMMRAMRDELIRHQHDDGSWGWSRTSAQDVDMTAAAVAALAAGGVERDHASIERALAWLREQLEESGGFRNDNLQSTAWAIWGLRSAGEDLEGEAWTSASGANPVSWLRTQVQGGKVEEKGLWVARDVLLALSAARYPVAGWLPLEASVETETPLAGAPTRFRTAGSATRFAWDFGDGATGEGDSPAHVYPRQGAYLVNLTAWDDGYGKALAQLSVSVDPAPPSAALEASRATAHRGEAITFSAVGSTDPDGSIVAYAWNFGDGTARAWSSSPVADHTYSKPGEYAPRVHVRDADGLESSTSTAVTILNRAPVVEPFSDQVAHRQTPLVLDARAVDPDGSTDRLSYSWDAGDGATVSGASFHHQYTSLGRFAVNLTVTDEDGGSATTSLFVAVLNLPPLIHDIATEADAMRENDSVRLRANATDPDGDIISYLWDFGDGSVLETPSPEVSHAYEAPGDYGVRVSVRDDDGAGATRALNLSISDSGVTAAEVASGNASQGDASAPHTAAMATPAIAPSLVASSTLLHRGEEIRLEVQSAPEGSRFRFNFGDGDATSWLSTASMRHAYVLPGDYEASATIQPPEGEPFTARLRIQVHNAAPEVRFSLPAEGDTVTPGALRLRGLASDTDGEVAAVEVWTDIEAVRAVGTFAWEAVLDVPSGAAGTLVVHARAVDDMGAWGETVQLVLSVEPPAAPPVAQEADEQSDAMQNSREASARRPAEDSEDPLASSSERGEAPGDGKFVNQVGASVAAWPASLAIVMVMALLGAAAAGALLLLRGGHRLRRNLAGLALACMALGLVAGLFLLQEARLDDLPASAEEIEVDVVFIGRDGEFFFNGTLRLSNATALSALDEAAREGGFTYRTTHYDYFGPGGAGVFVDEVRGERAERGDPDGWLYRIQRDGAWIRPDRSAAIYPLQDGDTVLWAWSSRWTGP